MQKPVCVWSEITAYTSSNVLQDNCPCHKAPIISNWFVEWMSSLDSSDLQDFSPIKHLKDAEEQETPSEMCSWHLTKIWEMYLLLNQHHEGLSQYQKIVLHKAVIEGILNRWSRWHSRFLITRKRNRSQVRVRRPCSANVIDVWHVSWGLCGQLKTFSFNWLWTTIALS